MGLNQTWNPSEILIGGFKPNPKPFSLETSEICVEIDTVYLLFCDLNLISFRRIRAFIRYFRKSWNRNVYLLFCDFNQTI